jgi:signal transduction histidine kinase
VERALYLVVREALFNTVIHAEATRARVSVMQDEGQVRVVVSDDGGGTAEQLQQWLQEAGHRSDGYHRGLANIDERARLLGGRLSFSDVPGGGLQVEVCLPLEDGAGL